MEVPFLSGTAFFSFSISTRGLASGCSLFFSFFILFFNWKEAKSEIADKESKRLSSYQYVGRTGSVIPTASLAGTEVSVEEIRSAAAFSDYYPPSLHAALISSPEPDPDGNLIFYSQFAICSFILLNLS